MTQSAAATNPVLARSFERAWHGIGAEASGAALFDELLAAYAEPHRRYHTLQHLVECLQGFETVRALAQRPAEVELALWFHDAVYALQRGDNEAQSADWARRALSAAAVPAPAIQRVQELVMVTRHRGLPEPGDQQLLVDIDLSILGASGARFSEYERQIRDEYGFVPDELFRHKRREILSAFLDRPRLYGSAHFHQALEARARENLRCAVVALD